MARSPHLIHNVFILWILLNESIVHADLILAKQSWLSTFVKRSGEESRLSILNLFPEQSNQKSGNIGNLLIDLNHSPPPSPSSLSKQNNQIPQTLLSSNLQQPKKRTGKKAKYMPEEQTRVIKQQSSQRSKRYSIAAVQQAKEQLNGEELKKYLQKADQFRTKKRIRDCRDRERSAQRFRSGLQTPQDEKKRMQAIQRGRRFREKKKNAKKDIGHSNNIAQ